MTAWKVLKPKHKADEGQGSNQCTPSACPLMQLRPLLVLGAARSLFGIVVVAVPGNLRMVSSRSAAASNIGCVPSSSLGTPLTLLDVSKRSKDITATASLDFSDSPLLIGESFKASSSDLTAETINAIAGCTSLNSLDISGCGELTDEALQTMVTGCVLTSINVSGCRKLTDEAITVVASSSLQSLNVAYCGKLLTDASIKAVAASCPALTSLNVADCKFLTDASITAIATGCSSLTSLDLSRCKGLTDDSIKALAAGCPSLTYLNVRNCEQLTDGAIKALATLPELASLRIFGCRKLTDESIRALAGCAKLTTLDTTNTFRQLFRATRGNN